MAEPFQAIEERLKAAFEDMAQRHGMEGKSNILVVTIPDKDTVMAYGSSGGSQKDKLEETPVALQGIEGSDIQIPATGNNV